MANRVVIPNLLEGGATGTVFPVGTLKSDAAWTTELGAPAYTYLQANGTLLLDTSAAGIVAIATKAFVDAQLAKAQN